MIELESAGFVDYFCIWKGKTDLVVICDFVRLKSQVDFLRCPCILTG